MAAIGKDAEMVKSHQTSDAPSGSKPEETVQNKLVNEAHMLLHDQSISPKQAKEQIDGAYTRAENNSNLSEEQAILLKLDHATMMDVYGFSHNDQASKDRAAEILNSLPDNVKKGSALIAGALVQVHDNKPIDVRDDKAYALAVENAAETTIKGAFAINDSDTNAKWASKQLSMALLMNPEETKARWSSFNKDHKYDSIFNKAEQQAAEERELRKNWDKNPADSSVPADVLTASDELAHLSKPKPGEGDADGVLYLKGALSNTLSNFDQNNDREIGRDELQSAAAQARKEGDERKANALEFAERNFDKLHLSSEDDSLWANHKGISRSDIAELKNYESFIDGGKWLGKNPLLSETTLNRASIAGAALGTVAEAATFVAGVGLPIANYFVTTGAIGNGIGLGGYAAYRSLTDSGKTSMTEKAFTTVGLTALGAFGGAVIGAAWGPFFGSQAATTATEAVADKIWNMNHRTEYKNMYGAMRNL